MTVIETIQELIEGSGDYHCVVPTYRVRELLATAMMAQAQRDRADAKLFNSLHMRDSYEASNLILALSKHRDRLKSAQEITDHDLHWMATNNLLQKLRIRFPNLSC